MLFSESFPPGFVSKFKHFKDLRRITPGSAAITTIMAPWQENRSVRGQGLGKVGGGGLMSGVVGVLARVRRGPAGTMGSA